MGIEDLATKGERKLARKIPSMRKSYDASESRAKKHYKDVGFGPTRTGNYDESWKTNSDNYDTMVKPGIEKKWRENWLAKMRE